MGATDILDEAARVLPAGSGPIGLLSGDEFRTHARAFDQRMLDLTGPRVGLVFCADHANEEHSARLGIAYFEALGAQPFVANLHTDELGAFDLLYLAGGSPAALLNCLRDAPGWREAMVRWRDGAGIAGSSAGAMALCPHVQVPRPGASVPTEWTPGVGPIETFTVAVHASSRPRAWLDEAARNAPLPLIALDDNAGVIVRTLTKSKCFGNVYLV